MNFDESNFPHLPSKTDHEVFVSFLARVFFQLHRKREKTHLYKFGDLFSQLLSYSSNYQDIIIKIIFYTRDIRNGKGEYDLSYEMIYRLYLHDPTQVSFILPYFVNHIPINHSEGLYFSPIGSWKDMKLLSIFIFERTNNLYHPIIILCVQLFNAQLDKDIYETQPSNISNVAKWIPRENKVDWLFNLLAIDWAKKHTPYLLHKHSFNLKSVNKSRMNYRKIISRLNRQLNTTEIHLCEKTIDQIEPPNVPISTFMKNQKLFLDLYSYGNHKKELLTEKFKKYIDSTKENRHKKSENINDNNEPYNIDLCKMVRNAWKLLEDKNKIAGLIVGGDMNKYLIDYLNIEHKIYMLNKLWTSFIDKCAPLETTIPCIDVSLSMHEYNRAPLFEAIGIAIAISNKSAIKDRILALDNEPIWIHLPNKESCIEYGFVSQVKAVFDAIRSKPCSSIKNGMQLIADSLQVTKTSYKNIERLSVILLSNFKQSFSESEETLHSQIISSFYSATAAPYFIYWNLASDVIELPADENTKRVCLYSGSTLSNIHYLNTLYSKSDREMDTGLFIIDLLNKKYPLSLDYLASLVSSDFISARDMRSPGIA